MPEQGSIVCPDCGAAYQCTPEQSGKLLHCKCGRYLVAGGNNYKSVSAPAEPKPAASAPVSAPPAAPKAPVPARKIPETDTSFAVKSVTPIAAKVKTEVAPKAVEDEREPAESKNLLPVAIAVIAILVVGAGFFVMRSKSAVKASTPQVIEAPVATNTPAPCSTVPYRLENGTALAHSQLGSGLGKLEIENQMPTDAVVRLTGSANLTVAWVYVQQGQKISLENIPLGTHRVMISSGSDWDSQSLAFKCNDSYAALDKPLEYNDRREDDRTTYSAYRLVLGKQRMAMITKDDFFTGYIGGAK